MNNVGERVKQVRKQKNLTQQKFADALGTKRNTVAQWELGLNALTDLVITSICREFGVNESWLRTGEGEMFIPLSRSQEISGFVGKILKGEEDTFKRRFVAMLSRLDEDDWAVLEKMANEMKKD